MSKKAEKAEDKPDYEALYYLAKRENQLLTDKKIQFDLTQDEINLIKDLLFEELIDLKNAYYEPSLDLDEDEEAEQKLLNKPKSIKDGVLRGVLNDRRMKAEDLMTKLNFQAK
jgi:hypothetical protein